MAKRYLFIIQGEGLGHSMQAVAVKRLLESRGHVVEKVLIGICGNQKVSDIVASQLNVPIQTFHTAAHIGKTADGKRSSWRSLAYHLMHLDKVRESMHFLKKEIEESSADYVINFFEIIAGLTYYYLKPSKPQICIANQYTLLRDDYAFMHLNPITHFFTKWFIKATCAGSILRLGLSMTPKETDDIRNQVHPMPPIIRQEIKGLAPHTGDFILAYSVAGPLLKDIEKLLCNHPDLHARLYDDNHPTVSAALQKRINLCQLSTQHFADAMSQCRVFVSTAGFDVVCEAMYLGKRSILFPSQMEQKCNLNEARSFGMAIKSGTRKIALALNDDEMDSERMTGFRQWADSWEEVLMNHLEKL